MRGSEWLAWTRDIRPIPAPKVIKPVLAILITVGVIEDLRRPEIDFQTALGVADFALPFAPAVALIISPLAGAVTLLLSLPIVFFVPPESQLLQGFGIATSIILFSTWALFPRKQAVYFTGMVVAIQCLALTRVPEGMWKFFSYYVSVFALFVGAGFMVSLLFQKVDAKDKELVEAREKQLQARREERQQLAYELHDIVAHDITIIAMQARRAEFSDNLDHTKQMLASIGTAAQQTIQDLRSLLVVLRDSAENDTQAAATDTVEDLLALLSGSGETTTALGLIQDFNEVADSVERADFQVERLIEGEMAAIPTSVRQVLRRTIRELATNMVKHGEPHTRALMNLTVNNDYVTLSTQNKISHKKPVMSSHTGMEALKARAEVFGGTVQARAIGEMWCTVIEIPLTGLGGSIDIDDVITELDRNKTLQEKP